MERKLQEMKFNSRKYSNESLIKTYFTRGLTYEADIRNKVKKTNILVTQRKKPLNISNFFEQ